MSTDDEMVTIRRVDLESIDRNARAYGWEIGRGQALSTQVDVTEGNPFMDTGWKASVPLDAEISKHSEIESAARDRDFSRPADPWTPRPVHFPLPGVTDGDGL
jgi:hypothetical protein